MASHLVSYSSEDEEDNAAKKKDDVNYDEVNMDCSDQSDDAQSDSEKLFASKEEYLAYKDQFKTKKTEAGKSKGADLSSEYGAVEPDLPRKKAKVEKAVSPDRGRHDKPKDHKHEHRSSHHKASRTRSRSPDNHHRHRSSKDHKRSHRDFERVSSKDDRSRTRDGRRDDRRDSRRDNNRNRRRSRSRSPNSQNKFHQERRNRKLLSMGLASQEELDMADGFNKTKQVDAQYEKIKEMTGVELPKYYNPNAINPLKFAEQIKKRQMLWSKKPSSDPHSTSDGPETSSQPVQQANPPVQQSFNKWESTNFGSSQQNEKFRRLMGIKGDAVKEPPPESSGSNDRSATMFAALDQQYQKARTITHTQRGLGLGFSGSIPQTLGEQPSSSGDGEQRK